MTTSTWDKSSDNDTSDSPNPIKFIVPIGIVCALLLGAFLYFMSQRTVSVAFTGDYVIDGYIELTPAQIRIIEIVSGHSYIRHGNEVNEAFRCIGKYGTSKTFKTFGFKGSKGEFIPTNLWMCFDKDSGDWYAIVTTIFEKIGNDKVAKLITSYRIAKDLFPKIDDYLEHIANKWGAVVVNYAINAEQIFIRPK